MRMIRILLTVAIFSLLAATQAGCLVVAAAAGTGATVAYVRGDLETSVDATSKQTADATVAATKNLGMALIANNTDGMGGNVVARTADDTKVEISLKPVSDKVTHVTIRAGIFGDNTIQQRMLDRIKTELAAANACPAPVASATTRPAVTADAR